MLANVEYAQQLVKTLCGYLEQEDKFKNGAIFFEAVDVYIRPRGYFAKTRIMPHAALGMLIVTGYITQVPSDTQSALYSATRAQLQRLKRDVLVANGQLFLA